MTDSDRLELAPLLARRELWLLVSVAFADPYQRQRFGLLRTPAFRERALEAAALMAQEHSAIELGPGEVSPKELSPRGFFAALDAEEESIEATYRHLFGLTAVSLHCPPCEVEYEPNTDVAYRSQRLADIAGFYQAFAMQLSPRTGERLDHITVEAEFLYLLLAKEAAALHDQNREGIEVCWEARRTFFQEHVGWWLPVFSHVLSRAAPPGYYRQLASLTAGISALERVTLGLAPFQARIIPKPSGGDPLAACFHCGSNQRDS